jgi:hypothetical protein
MILVLELCEAAWTLFPLPAAAAAAAATAGGRQLPEFGSDHVDAFASGRFVVTGVSPLLHLVHLG